MTAGWISRLESLGRSLFQTLWSSRAVVSVLAVLLLIAALTVGVSGPAGANDDSGAISPAAVSSIDLIGAGDSHDTCEAIGGHHAHGDADHGCDGGLCGACVAMSAIAGDDAHQPMALPQAHNVAMTGLILLPGHEPPRPLI